MKSPITYVNQFEDADFTAYLVKRQGEPVRQYFRPSPATAARFDRVCLGADDVIATSGVDFQSVTAFAPFRFPLPDPVAEREPTDEELRKIEAFEKMLDDPGVSYDAASAAVIPPGDDDEDEDEEEDDETDEEYLERRGRERVASGDLLGDVFFIADERETRALNNNGRVR